MSSPSPPPRKPRADSPEDLIDVMPIPFYLCATSSEVNEDPDEASMSSQTFLEMLCYFYGDILSRVLGKRQQSDQKDETTPMPRSVSFLDTQTGISPLPSPGPPSRTNISVPKDLLNAPAIGKKAMKLKSPLSKVASSVETKDPPSQAKDAGEDRSSLFLSTTTFGESVSPPMAASMPPPEASVAFDDIDDECLNEFVSMIVTPAPSEHEMRDDVSGGVYTSSDSRGDYPRPMRLDWNDMDEEMESLVLVPQAQTVPNAITKTPPAAAQHDLKPRGTLMNRKDRFSHPKKKPIIISEQDVTDEDVLCGRDSRGSKHKGNVFYRDVVGKKRSIYKGFAKRQNKTDLSTLIIEDVIKGRFLTKHKGKQYRVFTLAESRKKVSQSLRENPLRKK